jgi:hypothetical protein
MTGAIAAFSGSGTSRTTEGGAAGWAVAVDVQKRLSRAATSQNR